MGARRVKRESDHVIETAIRNSIRSLRPTEWLPSPESAELSLLADGTYHTSYLVATHQTRIVARVCRESQWGLELPDQLAREFAVLRDLVPSGAAPTPFHILADGEVPFMLESFVAGRAFSYATDLGSLAVALAGLHACSPDAAPLLVGVEDPAEFLLTDGELWLQRANGHHRFADALSLLTDAAVILKQGPRIGTSESVIVHTDLIQSNILMTDEGCVVVDWEGAKLGPRAWDLAYFLSPVTLAWAEPQSPLPTVTRRTFIEHYAAAARLDQADLGAEIEAILPYVVFRAVCWCIGHAATTSELTPRARDRLRLICHPSFIQKHLLKELRP
jgi:aminoglycoside phosphotransferase (APT) family kinase protein